VDLNEVQLGTFLGRGGFGEVYKGMWRGTEVAVKKLLHQKMTTKQVREFRREVQTMSKLRHPNVVLFMGANTRPPNLCILTEFLLHGNLYDVLHDKRVKIDWKLMIRMATDAARGMNYLHCSKPVIMHRDLKSLNLLVDQNWGVKVSDFGLTKSKMHTYTMTQCGTPQWMAPEVLRNEQYNETADIYSYGVILWELYTRKDPYAGMNPMQVGMKVLLEGMRPPIPTSCPSAYAKLMQACWDQDPEARPDFGEILNRLSKM